jgi:molybdate transport system ATP-binding protein
MVNVNVQYGDRSILKNISWEVKKGERWSISGPNGAGKSTLLSLITGDNTKAYANEIYLFDKRRGSGESIWDIKKKIGYVSPEMHVYFDYTATCFETVASGLFDSIGLFRALTAAQRDQVNQWVALFHLEAVQNKLLSLLSAGEQRLVLLARALVKNPPLLILDEPCQGLDQEHVQQFRLIIDDICRMFDTTLLYVSHYKEEIPECVTHFMQIEEGEAVFTVVEAQTPFLYK